MAAVMWGVSGLFAKGLFDISPKLTPMWLTQVRLIISGAVLLIASGFLKQKPIATMKNSGGDYDPLSAVLYHGLR